jgi:segregation and condensation protein A
VSYRVKTQVFSGPFDLLLSLVSRQKVDIGSISIAEVADQYLAEVERMGELDLDVASDFVLVASALLDIKAASLVPEEGDKIVSMDEDELDEEFANLSPAQARELLIERLITYKQFRSAAAALASRERIEALMVGRTAGPDPAFLNLMPDYLEGISLVTLATMCADMTARHQNFLLDEGHIAPHRLPVILTVASIDRITRTKPEVSFMELLGDDRRPEVVVATFLAMLELFKLGSIHVNQTDIFGDITITRVEGAPAFELDERELTSIGEDDL